MAGQPVRRAGPGHMLTRQAGILTTTITTLMLFATIPAWAGDDFWESLDCDQHPVAGCELLDPTWNWTTSARTPIGRSRKPHSAPASRPGRLLAPIPRRPTGLPAADVDVGGLEGRVRHDRSLRVPSTCVLCTVCAITAPVGRPIRLRGRRSVLRPEPAPQCDHVAGLGPIRWRRAGARSAAEADRG